MLPILPFQNPVISQEMEEYLQYLWCLAAAVSELLTISENINPHIRSFDVECNGGGGKIKLIWSLLQTLHVYYTVTNSLIKSNSVKEKK